MNKFTKPFSFILISFCEVYDTANINDNRIRTRNKTFEIFLLLAMMFSISLVYPKTNK